MNKAIVYAIGVLGAVGITILPSNISYAQGRAVQVPPVVATQQPPQPHEIKFGHSRTLAYEVGNEQPPIPIGRLAVNRGTILYRPDGGFELWGVLDGIAFSYRHLHQVDGTVLEDKLTLNKGDYEVRLVNRPTKGLNDRANVNGVDVGLDGSNFYEKPFPTGQWKNLSLKERLHRTFKDWEQRLNIGAVKTEAERLKVPQQKLLESLDAFVVK